MYQKEIALDKPDNAQHCSIKGMEFLDYMSCCQLQKAVYYTEAVTEYIIVVTEQYFLQHGIHN